MSKWRVPCPLLKDYAYVVGSHVRRYTHIVGNWLSVLGIRDPSRGLHGLSLFEPRYPSVPISTVPLPKTRKWKELCVPPSIEYRDPENIKWAIAEEWKQPKHGMLKLGRITHPACRNNQSYEGHFYFRWPAIARDGLFDSSNGLMAVFMGTK